MVVACGQDSNEPAGRPFAALRASRRYELQWCMWDGRAVICGRAHDEMRAGVGFWWRA